MYCHVLLFIRQHIVILIYLYKMKFAHNDTLGITWGKSEILTIYQALKLHQNQFWVYCLRSQTRDPRWGF